MPATTGVDIHIGIQSCAATGNGGMDGLTGSASSEESWSFSDPLQTPASQPERLPAGFVSYYGSCQIAAEEE